MALPEINTVCLRRRVYINPLAEDPTQDQGRSDACKFDLQAAVKRRKMEGSKKHIYYSAAVQIKFSSRVRESKLLAV